MDSKRKIAAGIATTAVGLFAMGGTASAGHTHCMGLPNGNIIEVAEGSTSQTTGGAFHKFHFNVHFGATDHTGYLGDGNSPVTLYKVTSADCP
ncbi:MAG: hypothetical protein M3503_07725 [Actinomycetota bacterium]|nr:hypothetical protein [Actinomycetota bacterium]